MVNASHEECESKYNIISSLYNKEQQEKVQAIQSYESWRYKCELLEVQNKTLNVKIREQDDYIK